MFVLIHNKYYKIYKNSDDSRYYLLKRKRQPVSDDLIIVPEKPSVVRNISPIKRNPRNRRNKQDHNSTKRTFRSKHRGTPEEYYSNSSDSSDSSDSSGSESDRSR